METVSSRLDGFTGQQCMHRWTKALRPTITHGKWLEEEDKRLVMGVAFFGCRGWNEVARCVRTKTDVQCRERWTNVLSPNVRQGAWTKEEDALLLGAVEKYGVGKWALVARAIPNRTDNHCWRRWKELKRDSKQQDEVDTYRTEVRQKKQSLPTMASRRPQDRSSITLAQLQEVGRSAAVPSEPRKISSARRNSSGAAASTDSAVKRPRSSTSSTSSSESAAANKSGSTDDRKGRTKRRRKDAAGGEWETQVPPVKLHQQQGAKPSSISNVMRIKKSIKKPLRNLQQSNSEKKNTKPIIKFALCQSSCDCRFFSFLIVFF